MGYWSSSVITVYGDAYINLNEEVSDRKEDIIKLFTDDELNEEIKKREVGESKYENFISKLKTYIYNADVDVSRDDVLDEIGDFDLIDEVKKRNLHIEEELEIDKYKLRKIICNALDINEMYDDEEIFEMLREIWRIRR